MSAVVLSCGGVGYYAQCPASVAGALPGVGKEATLYTVMVYRYENGRSGCSNRKDFEDCLKG